MKLVMAVEGWMVAEVKHGMHVNAKPGGGRMSIDARALPRCEAIH